MKYSVIQCRKMSELFTSIIITEQISIHHFYFNILRATNTKLRHHLFSIFFLFQVCNYNVFGYSKTLCVKITRQICGRLLLRSFGPRCFPDVSYSLLTDGKRAAVVHSSSTAAAAMPSIKLTQDAQQNAFTTVKKMCA